MVGLDGAEQRRGEGVRERTERAGQAQDRAAARDADRQRPRGTAGRLGREPEGEHGKDRRAAQDEHHREQTVE